MTRRVRGRWPGLRTGVASCVLGLLLAISAYALQAHAARGTLVEPGETFDLGGARPAHVVGVVSPGVTGEPATCTATTGDGEPRRFEVGIRATRSQSILAGRRAPAGTVTVTCDQRFAVVSGPAVIAYPLARSWSLVVAYLAVALVGLALVRHEVRRERRIRRGPGLAVPPTAALAAGPAAVPAKLGDPPQAPPPRDRHGTLGAALFLVAIGGTLSMVLVSTLVDGRELSELARNLLLLLVVCPAALSAGILLRRRPAIKSYPPG